MQVCFNFNILVNDIFYIEHIPINHNSQYYEMHLFKHYYNAADNPSVYTLITFHYHSHMRK